ncbi:MAG: hypothetical protein ACOX7J_00010 [Bacillota bacterium]
MKKAFNSGAAAKNAKKPLWTKIVTAILIIIAIDMAMLLLDFTEVFITAQPPRFAQETAVSADGAARHYTGLGYSFDLEGSGAGDSFQMEKANLNIFGQYLCTTK